MLTSSNKAHNRKWLYLPLEVQFRELSSKFLLSCVAAENGYSCLIGEGSIMERQLSQLPPGITYVNACGNGIVREKFFDAIQKNGHKIVANDEETTAIYNNTPSRWLRGRLSAPLFEKIDQYHAWGQRQADLMQNHMKYSSDKLHVTGTYRADIWQQPLCEIHRKEADRLRAKYGPYILLSSTFTMNFDPRGAEYHLQYAKDYRYVLNDHDEQEYWEMVNHIRAVAKEFVSALEPISAAFPNHTVIVRPHPTEGEVLWNEAIGDIPGVRVVYEGEASPWLLGADAIFHNGCTNAFEARLQGKIPVTYHPIPNSKYEEAFLFKMGPNAENVEELIQHLKDVISRRDIKAKIDPEFQNYVLSTQNELACDRIIAAMNELDVLAQPHNLSLSNYAHGLREKTKLPLFKKLSRTARKSSNTNISPPKWAGIHLSEIKVLLKQLQTHLNRFENVEVIDFSRRLFLVRQKV